MSAAGCKVKSDHRWGVLVVLCAAALIINVDNTILNVALPTLVRELHATSSQLQWIVDSYAMVFAGLLLVSGSLADRFGRQKFFLLGLAVFGTGSIAAAFSGSVRSPDPVAGPHGPGRRPDDPVVAVHRQRRLPGPETAGAKPSVPGAASSGSGSPSALSPAACCWRISGGGLFSWSMSP